MEEAVAAELSQLGVEVAARMPQFSTLIVEPTEAARPLTTSLALELIGDPQQVEVEEDAGAEPEQPLPSSRRKTVRKRARGAAGSVSGVVGAVLGAAERCLEANADEWERVMPAGCSWRVLCVGLPDHGGGGSWRVESGVGTLVSRRRRAAAGPLGKVSLSAADTTVVAFVTKSAAAASEHLVAFGTTGAAAPLRVSRGVAGSGSRANDAVAGCLARAAVSSFSGAGPHTVLDPMCGVGTLLLAVREWWTRYGGPADILRTRGRDSDEGQIRQAAENTAACGMACDLAVADAAGLGDIPDGSVSVVLTDPPWGQRHGLRSTIRKGLHRWCAEWLRVLADGGVLLMVTIRTQQVEREALPWLRRRYDLSEDSVTFDNGGHTQCKLYRWRKIRARPDFTPAMENMCGYCDRPMLRGLPTCCDRCCSSEGPHAYGCRAPV
eukprot:TRINITY_DN36455_c0_g1_i1.p1 TRINITY_DN36455_c0_g1~~TRINITY_DN36455_c0_g1_i1.p1  ORF type:complete len:467 (+),score=176.81 TRINITY_DN36455_c0_g1_i1:91-1401(+)